MIFNMTGKSGNTLLVSDTTDSAGGTIRNITATKVVKLQPKTITPTSSVQTVNPDTGYDGFNQVTVNAGGSSSDFIVTLYYEQYEQYGDTYFHWVPDKTVAEIYQAYLDDLNIRVVADVDSYSSITWMRPDYISAGCNYVSDYGSFMYSVITPIIQGGDGYIVSVYEYHFDDVVDETSLGNYYNYILQSKTVTPTTSQQVITPDNGYNALDQVTVNAMSSGSVTSPSSISGTSATVSTGTNTLTLTKSISNTPNVTRAGYISSGTAGNTSVSLTASVTTKAAATITPGTSNQTIASGTYLTGTQTIAGDADLVASNIVSGVQIFGVTGNVVLQNYYTGSSAPSSSLGSNGDLYLQS